jgi:hypothetical protein
MAGKYRVTGVNQPKFREAKAYAEGRAGKIAGLVAGNNPHPAASPAGVAWLAGLNEYITAGVVQPRDHCADLPKV